MLAYLCNVQVTLTYKGKLPAIFIFLAFSRDDIYIQTSVFGTRSLSRRSLKASTFFNLVRYIIERRGASSKMISPTDSKSIAHMAVREELVK